MELMSLSFDETLILEVKGEKVKITLLQNKDNPDEYAFGIDAPRSVALNREEIYKKKKRRDNS